MKNKILLISMPFGPLTSPSIGLTLLKQTLLKNSIESEILYLNLLFAKHVGISMYSKISSGFPVNHDMLGEWIFSSSLFENRENTEEFINEIIFGGNSSHNKSKLNKEKISKDFVSKVLKIKDKVNLFIEECVEIIIEKQPAIVGFTSVFQQQLSSLALAQRLKQRLNNVKICFGGANNEGQMGIETIKKFPFIDYVVSGEGEEAFLFLVRQILDGKQCDDYSGIISQNNYSNYIALSKISTKQISNLDALPQVNYSDYFIQLAQLKLGNKFLARIPFETSRGCWWGMKNHCTFCGLNGENMTQRTKSSERAMSEFKYLLKTHAGHPVSVVDNILDYNYFKDFIPALIKLRKKKEYDLFYEVKANLTKEQLLMLKKSGITIIQPGIESFCKGTLKIMRKGVSPIQNIQLLKWCKELNIKVEWNMLYGFPNENIEEYEDVAKFLPLLSHLDPPNGFGPIRLDRFSPNFNEYDKLGFKEIEPYPTYGYIYPFEKSSLFNLAYYFTYSYKDNSFDFSKLKPFSQRVKKWKKTHNISALFYSDNNSNLIIWDLRPIAKTPIYVLSKNARAIYLSCDKGQRLSQCIQNILDSTEVTINTEQEVLSTLNFFIKQKLMIFHDDHFLSLAISDSNIKNTKSVTNKISQLVSIDKFETEETLVLNQSLFV